MKKLAGLLLAVCLVACSVICLAEETEDYSYLEDMTVKEVKSLKSAIDEYLEKGRTEVEGYEDLGANMTVDDLKATRRAISKLLGEENDKTESSQNNNGLSDAEQYICDLISEHVPEGSSTVELSSGTIMFSLKEGVDNYYTFENVDPGKYVLALGSEISDLGTKYDYFHEFWTNEEGKVYDVDVYSIGSSNDSLQDSYDEIRSLILDMVIDYASNLESEGREITFEEFQNGELGYVPLDDESLDRINKVLSEKTMTETDR